MRYHPALAPFRTLIGALFLSLVLPLGAADPAEEKDPTEKFAWKDGPTEGDLNGRAKLKVPEGFRFLEAAEAGKLMVLMGNQSSATNSASSSTGMTVGPWSSTSTRWAT